MAYIRPRGFVSAAFALLLCVGCPDPEPPEPVRIGVILSQTGGLSSVADHLTKAVQLAQREANSAGGLLDNREVELVVRDDQTMAPVAEAAAIDLIENEGVVAIIGSLASSASLTVAAVAYDHQIPQISCCSTSPDLDTAQPETDRYFFRTVPSDFLQALVIARYAVVTRTDALGNPAPCNALAILHQDDSYGNPLGAALQTSYEQLQASTGGTGVVVARMSFPAMQSDYSTILNDFVASFTAPADCLAVITFPAAGGKIISDWNMDGHPTVQWIGTDGVRDSGLIDAVGGATNEAFVDGLVGTAPITAPATQAYNDFAASYDAAFGSATGIFGGNQYDAAVLLMLAIEAAGSTEGPAIRDALYRVSDDATGSEAFFGPGQVPVALDRIRQGADINYEGASGPVDFDSFGNVVSDYEIWQYQLSAHDFVRIGTVPGTDINP